MSGFKRHRAAARASRTSPPSRPTCALARRTADRAAPQRGGHLLNRSDPLEDLLDFSGPTTAPDDPVLARLFPTAYPDDDEAAGDFRRFTESTLRDGKADAAATIIDTLEEAGLPPEPEDGLFIDVELDQEATMIWMRSFTDMRLAIATRLGVEEGDEDHWALAPRRRSPRPGPRHLRLARLLAGDPRPGRDLTFRWLRSERQRASRNHCMKGFDKLNPRGLR